MKLTRVELRDFRCFGEVSFDLMKPDGKEPLDVALLVGENGVGKSAVLDALVGLFSEERFHGTLPDYGGRKFRLSDTRQGANGMRVAARWRDWVAGVSMDLGVDAHLNDQELRTEGTADLDRWKAAAKNPTGPTGLITMLDVYRLIAPGDVAGPSRHGVIRHRCESALAPTIDSRGSVRPRAQLLKQWIINIDALRAKAKADQGVDLPLWHTLRTALNTLLNPYTFEGVDEDFDVLFQTRSGRVPIEALSDGFRSIFAIVSDLLLRLSLATSDQTKILEGEAVCLIDEIDAHLHPRWQETVIPGLRAMFPNVQFIATTHSPYVVGSVWPENVFLLEVGEG